MMARSTVISDHLYTYWLLYPYYHVIWFAVYMYINLYLWIFLTLLLHFIMNAYIHHHKSVDSIIMVIKSNKKVRYITS